MYKKPCREQDRTRTKPANHQTKLNKWCEKRSILLTFLFAGRVENKGSESSIQKVSVIKSDKGAAQYFRTRNMDGHKEKKSAPLWENTSSGPWLMLLQKIFQCGPKSSQTP
jgi:hypothetical protein